VCVLLTLARGSAAGELWVAANRDERLDRPWEPPRVLRPDPPVFGGRDVVGGGSWLAVNLEAGFVVAVTNARRGALPRERSRGALVVDLAAERTLPEALALLSELDLARYGLFNLFLGDNRERWLATNHPFSRVERIQAPVAAIGNDPLDAPGDRVMRASERAMSMRELPADALRADLERLLGDHEGEDSLCRHGETYGTVCSTVVGLAGSEVATYRFAAGPPCVTAFAHVAVSLHRPHGER
jgi:uncharacterized protein with NRDE domain